MVDEPLTAGQIEERIVAAIEQVHRTGVIEVPDKGSFKLEHHVSPAEGLMLRDLVAQQRPQRTIEIGMGTGLSGLHICWGLARAAGDGPLGTHLAIDPFQTGEFWQGRGLALRDQAGCRDIFQWRGERDDKVLPEMLAKGEQVQFALIDGDHRFEAAMLDFYYLDKLLPVGGVCVFDDTDWPSVWRVVQFARTHRHYQWIDAVPVDQGPLTRPWGWKLRIRRWQTFRRQNWPLFEAIRRKPYQFIALRKTAEDNRPEHFWSELR